MKRLAVILLLLLGAISSPGSIGSPAFAQAQRSWNGTWAGGWSEGTGAQIVFAGDEFIAIYWRDDYVSDATGAVSPDGATATIRMVARRSRPDPRRRDQHPRHGAGARPPRGVVRAEEGLSRPPAAFGADHICGRTCRRRARRTKRNRRPGTPRRDSSGRPSVGCPAPTTAPRRRARGGRRRSGKRRPKPTRCH